MHKYLIILVSCFLFFLTKTYAQSGSPITFSEIMFAPLSGQSEFVEVFNTSENDTIDLSGFQLKYLHTSNTDNIITYNNGLKLNPKNFAIVFEDDYDFINGIYNSLIPAEALILKIDNGSFASGLSNTTDRTLFLINSSGDTVDTYTYSANNSNGVSDEKIILNKNNLNENWSNSLTQNGTPGNFNSVSPLNYDLAAVNLSITPEIQFAGSEINLNFTVKNLGIYPADIFSVNVFDDINYDSSGSENEFIFFKSLTNLHSGDSINLNLEIPLFEERNYRFYLEINFSADQNLSNNFSFIDFKPLSKPAEFNDIIINEIMYKPPNDEPEWIEILNNGNKEINLQHWSLSDRNSKINIAEDSVILIPGEYLVLSEDESITQFYNIESQLIILKLPSLNNSGDDLYLSDQYNNIIDSVLYLSSWGGNAGTSLEKIDKDASGSDSLNWSSAVTNKHATPGAVNSITQKDYDIRILELFTNTEYVITPNPASINIKILNAGKNSVNNIMLNFYNDFNNDSLGTANEIIHSASIPFINNGDSIFYSFDHANYNTGDNLIIAKAIINNDNYPEDNIAFINFNAVIINEIRNDIVINEFMPAPNSGESEWIEIFNRSNKHIDLKNYIIADESDSVKFLDTSFILNPGAYFLIIDDSSFLNNYKTETFYVIINFPALNNTSDKIILIDSLKRIIDSLHYNSEWTVETGISIERIDPFEESEFINNWQKSKDISGATPGKINSVAVKFFDASITQINFNPPRPFYGDDVSISAIIKNVGKEISSINVLLYEEDSLLETSELVSINPGDSIIHIFKYKIENLESRKNFAAEIKFNFDQDTTNNFSYSSIIPGYKYNSLIINELMFTPQNGEPEWIEIYNNTNHRIYIEGFSISDILTNPVKANINDSDLFVEANSYLVIAKDSAILNYHDVIPSEIFIMPFANLNNSEDGVVIKDFYNNLIDSLYYTSKWNSKTGYSIERVSFSSASNDSSQWSSSADIEQSTPGRLNSTSQKTFDLALTDISFFPEMPKYGDEITIYVSIKSTGFLEAQNFHIKIFDKGNYILNDIFIPVIHVNDSLTINCGSYKLLDAEIFFAEIFFPTDYNYTNNKDSISIIPSYNKNDLLINEVMFNPAAEVPEWIEFINNSNHEINLFEWSVSDVLPSPKADFISNDYTKILPGQYFVITGDTSAFKLFYSVDSPVFQSSFGALGNGEDGIIIKDYYGNIIDSLFYTSEYGNIKGSSIERLSFSDSTNKKTIWFISINANGSTPGFDNSISQSKSYSRNQVIINEIMYEPGINNSEFIEFYNNSNAAVELGGWILENGKGDFFRITNSNYMLTRDSYYVAAADSLIYLFYNFNGEETNINILNKSGIGLTNDGQILTLKDIKGNIIDSLHYSGKWHNPNILETKNKSLERLNPLINSNDSSNWSTSANDIGATPGKKNSIFTDYKINSSGLTISPNPFSPDNDGFEDFCTINYNLGISLSQIRIKIFDDRGRLVRTLANNKPSGSTGTIIFNGLNDNNSPLRIGMYIIYFEATNSQTGAQEILKDVVVVARKL